MDDPWELIIGTEQAMYFSLHLPPTIYLFFAKGNLSCFFGHFQRKKPVS